MCLCANESLLMFLLSCSGCKSTKCLSAYYTHEMEDFFEYLCERHSVQGQCQQDFSEILYDCTNIWSSQWWWKKLYVAWGRDSERLLEDHSQRCGFKRAFFHWEHRWSCLSCSTGEKRKRIVSFLESVMKSEKRSAQSKVKTSPSKQAGVFVSDLAKMTNVWMAWCISW